MANSFVSYTADGATPTFAVPFGYLLKSHVKVYIDGVEDTTFTWPDGATVQPTTTPANGEVVLIQRTTPLESLYVSFTNGSTLTSTDMNDGQNQALYAAQERADLSGIELDTADDKFDAESKVIKNVANPVNTNDAVNKAYTDAIEAAAGNVPTPSDPGDDDKVLEANSGTFAWTTKAVTAAQVSDASANGRSLITAANYAAMRALMTPLTTNGDLWTYAGGVDARLAVGAANRYLMSDGTSPVWSSTVGWEYVASKTVSSDSLIEVFHDGFDSGSDFVDGYRYKLEFQNLYTASVNVSLYYQLYEGGSYRTAANSYYTQSIKIIGTAAGHTSTVASAGTISSLPVEDHTDFANNSGLHSEFILQYLASSSQMTYATAHNWSVSQSFGSYLEVARTSTRASNMTNAATKLKFYAASGNLSSGTVRLYRAKDT